MIVISRGFFMFFNVFHCLKITEAIQTKSIPSCFDKNLANNAFCSATVM